MSHNDPSIIKNEVESFMETYVSLAKLLPIENDIHEKENNCNEFNSKKKLVPKTHYHLHFEEAIKQVGPLRHLWTMGFEQLNALGKRLSFRTRNFKNVPFSMANHYQKLLTLSRIEKYTEQSFFPENTQSEDLFHYENQMKINITTEPLYFRGTNYYINDILVYDAVNGCPEIGQIDAFG